jgi:ribokinase
MPAQVVTPAVPSSTKPALVVVGSLNRDTVLEVARLPGPGDTVLATGPARAYSGGKGANQAAAAARFLGVPGRVAMVGRIGADQAGRAMVAELHEYGVDVRAVVPTSGPSGSATIAVDAAGENIIVVDPGANARLLPADVDLPVVTAAEVVLVQWEVPQQTVRAAIAQTRGRVVLNPAPYHQAGGYDGVDVLVPNRGELAALVGAAPADDIDSVLDQARRLGSSADLVVTMGAAGALVMTRTGRTEELAAPLVEVVDATGAGDCFCGVLAALLAEGADLVQAANLAVRAASLSVQAAGARGRLPRRSAL